MVTCTYLVRNSVFRSSLKLQPQGGCNAHATRRLHATACAPKRRAPVARGCLSSPCKASPFPAAKGPVPPPIPPMGDTTRWNGCVAPAIIEQHRTSKNHEPDTAHARCRGGTCCNNACSRLSNNVIMNPPSAFSENRQRFSFSAVERDTLLMSTFSLHALSDNTV